MTSTIDARNDARKSGTYDVYIDIDCDCEELLDAIGLDYITSEDDERQNEVALSLNKDEWSDFKARVNWSPLDLNEQLISAALLNDELSEYTTRVQVYTPNGDKITFE